MSGSYCTVPLKRCSRCKRFLPAKYPFFNRTKNKKSGLEYHCRACRYGWSDDEFQVDVLSHALLERGYKQCKDCDEVKLLNEFPKSKSCRGGTRLECIECHNAVQRTRYQNPDVQSRQKQYRQREDVKARRRDYQSQPEKKAKKSAYDRSVESRAVKNQYQRSEKFKVRRLEYYHRPDIRERKRVYGLQRRSKEEDGKTLTPDQWERALEYFQGRCAVCGILPTTKRTIAADHWKPLSKGGLTTADNIIPLCHSKKGDIDSCNNTKNARDPYKWLLMRYGEPKASEIMKHIQDYFDWVKEQDS